MGKNKSSVISTLWFIGAVIWAIPIVSQVCNKIKNKK